MLKISIIIVWFSLVFVSPAEAAAYKWVDDKGGIHFSDIPPLEAGVEVVPQRKFSPPNSAEQQRVDKLLRAQEESWEKRQEQKSERNEQATKKKTRMKECRRMQERTTQLGSRPARRNIITGDDGAQRRMTEEELQVRLEALRKRLEELCD